MSVVHSVDPDSDLTDLLGALDDENDYERPEMIEAVGEMLAILTPYEVSTHAAADSARRRFDLKDERMRRRRAWGLTSLTEERRHLERELVVLALELEAKSFQGHCGYLREWLAPVTAGRLAD